MRSVLIVLSLWQSDYLHIVLSLLLLGCHQCLVAVSSSVRVPPPTNLLWQLVHLPPHFPILLAVGWHLVSACNFKYICALFSVQSSNTSVLTERSFPSVSIHLHCLARLAICSERLLYVHLYKCFWIWFCIINVDDQQVPKYDCTVYIVFVCVLVSIWLINVFFFYK